MNQQHMKAKKILLWPWVFVTAILTTHAQIAETYTFTTFGAEPSLAIADGNASGVSDVRTLESAITAIESLTVSLDISGEFNGDLYAYLRHDSGFSVLLRSADDIGVVGEAGDGAEAVDIAIRERPDVILMDIRMPGTDGIEATRRITADDRLTNTRVLILTTFDLNEYVYEALRAGASGFLVKDTDPDELIHAIRVVAAGDALLAPSVTRRVVDNMARSPVGELREEPRLGELTERERVRHQRPTPSYFNFKNPPVRILQGREPLTIAGFESVPRVEVVLFDFGAVSVTYRLPLHGHVHPQRVAAAGAWTPQRVDAGGIAPRQAREPGVAVLLPQRQAAARRAQSPLAEEVRRERRAVRVGSGKHEVGRGVFGHRHALVVSHRRIIERRDGQAHRSQAAIGRAVERAISEAVRPTVIVGGCVSEAAIGAEGESTVQRTGHHHGDVVVLVGQVHRGGPPEIAITAQDQDPHRTAPSSIAWAPRSRRDVFPYCTNALLLASLFPSLARRMRDRVVRSSSDRYPRDHGRLRWYPPLWGGRALRPRDPPLPRASRGETGDR